MARTLVNFCNAGGAIVLMLRSLVGGRSFIFTIQNLNIALPCLQLVRLVVYGWNPV